MFYEASFPMEGKHLQARVARSYGLPALLLFTKFYLSILVGLYTKKNLRGNHGLLRDVQRLDSTLLRAGLLREHRDAEVVESVREHSLA